MMRSACHRLSLRAGRPVAATCVLESNRCSAGTLQIFVRSLASSADSGDIGRQRVWRWGATSGGAAGMMNGGSVAEIGTEPTLMEEFTGITTGACGSNHSGFVVDGDLFTFGGSKQHQLGREASDADSPQGAAPGQVVIEAEDGHRPRVQSVALGGSHSAVITEGGLLWTWGWGGSFWKGAGALGHGKREDVLQPTLVTSFVELGEEVRQVACAGKHTVVLTDQGRLYATGAGDFGRLGRGDTQDELEFEEIEYFFQANDSVLAPNEQPAIIKVGCGDNFSAVLSSQGEIWVWGRNDHGQLGLGEEAMGDMYSAERYPRLVRSLPVEGHRIVDFDCGENHLVVLTQAGAIYEWGNRTWLEPHPVSIPARYEEGLKDIIKVVAGEKCSFALTREGRVYSWGTKSSGCLAQGDDKRKNIVEPTPVAAEVFGHQKVLDIFASKHRCLAITQEGSHLA